VILKRFLIGLKQQRPAYGFNKPVGDSITNEGKIRLIAGTFNDAVLAVNSAKLYIDPSDSKMAGVSSHNDRFAEKKEDLRQKNKNSKGDTCTIGESARIETESMT